MNPCRQLWARWLAYGLDPFSGVGVVHLLASGDDHDRDTDPEPRL